MSLNKEQLQSMLDLRNEYNIKIDSNWRKSNYKFVDLIWLATSEAFANTVSKATGFGIALAEDCKCEFDIEQLRLDIIEVWSHVLSELLNHDEVEEMTYVTIVDSINEAIWPEVIKNPELDIDIIQTALKEMIASALMPRDEHRIMFLISSFIKLLAVVDMSWENLFERVLIASYETD